jgi:hypothetical protein
LIEIKSVETAIAKHAKNFSAFEASAGCADAGKYVVYDGPNGLRIAETLFVNWREMRLAESLKG